VRFCTKADPGAAIIGPAPEPHGRPRDLADSVEPMTANKTQRSDDSVESFIASVEDDAKRADAEALVALMAQVTGEAPAMWGSSIVGFGQRHMVYDSGREVDWFHVGFSPRKQNLTLYIMDGFDEYEELLDRLGRHSTGKACLYLKRLEHVDLDVLEELITLSVEHVRGA
jgi:hypothetical protein